MSAFNPRYNEMPQCIPWPSAGSQNDRTSMGAHYVEPSFGPSNTKEDVDLLIAQSLAALSFQERQVEQEDLHGVAKNASEDVEQIELGLNELNECLSRIKLGSVYQTAEAMNPSYGCDRDFRLMFLRSNRYEPQAAAEKIINFFSVKLKLFGKEKLVQDITLNDLTAEDREAVVNGHFQILRGTDRSKRHILVEFPALRSFKSLMNELRARFYMFMGVARSIETQLQGIVMVSYGVGDLRENLNGAGFVDLTKLCLSLPLHFAGVHLATDRLGHYVLLHGAMAITPSKIRTRFKLHQGSHLECQYSLSAYGIPREVLPLSETNEPILDQHRLWYEERFSKEVGQNLHSEEMTKTSYRTDPRPNDVLFGKKSNRNGGNKTLLSFVKEHATEYNDANKERKRKLINHVINIILSTQGRFLTSDSEPYHDSGTTIWNELSLEEVRGKVTQAFRNHRRPPAALHAKFSAAAGGAEPAFIVEQPDKNDVLFGRKRSNIGNRRVRQLVSHLSDEYNAATTKVKKREISDSVVEEVHRTCGRFLMQREGDRWEVVPNDFARNKIAKHFQNHRRPPKAASETGSRVSSTSSTSGGESHGT